MITTERTVWFNLMNVGSKSSQNPAELESQKLEEKTKNVVLNK